MSVCVPRLQSHSSRFWSPEGINCQLGIFLMSVVHHLNSKGESLDLLWQPQPVICVLCVFRLIKSVLIEEIVLGTDRLERKRTFPPHPGREEFLRRTAAPFSLPYQFQQVGRRAALLSQGLFQQSLPVLVLLTHTWGGSYTHTYTVFGLLTKQAGGLRITHTLLCSLVTLNHSISLKVRLNTGINSKITNYYI